MNDKDHKRYEELYQLHLDALTRQGKRKATIQAYSLAVRRITEHFDKRPDTLTREDLEAYFSALLKTHSWSTAKLDRCGLQFFFKHVLKKQWVWVDILKAPVSKKLPTILSLAEIEALINSAKELRYQTFLLCTYSMGLRLGEALNLHITDIDAKRKRILVRDGKGGKDRFVTLPHTTLIAMRRYWATHRNAKFIFPAGLTDKKRHTAEKSMPRGGIQTAFKLIARDAKILKEASVHTLRHCYGTHLQDAGVKLQKIQKEMGHECIKTTTIYIQLSDQCQDEGNDIINEIIDAFSIDWKGE